jgi:hypothetical protein
MGRYHSYDDLDDELDLHERRVSVDLPHSGIGMASFATALLAGVGAACAVIVLIAVDAAQQVPGADDEMWEVLAGLMFIGCGALAIAGFTLGLIGSFQHERQPTFAILGSVVNALVLVGMGIAVCAGILADF